MTLRTALSATTVTIVAALALAGCTPGGSSAPTATGAAALKPGTLATRAVAALTKSGTFHAVITTTDEKGAPLTVEVDDDKDGDWRAVLSNGISLIETSEGGAYIKAGKKFWVAEGVPSAAAKKLAGRWISSKDDLGESFSREDLVGQYTHLEAVTRKGTGTVDGQKALLVGGENFTLSIAAEGDVVLLKSEGTDKDAETIVFSGVSAKDAVEAPKGAKTVEKLLA